MTKNTSNKQASETERQELLEPRTLTLPPPDDYQSREAAMEQEFDMPGASEETVRRAFISPVNVRRERCD